MSKTENGETFLRFVMHPDELLDMIREYINQGYNVEKIGQSYIAHEQTTFGTALVLHAFKVGSMFYVKANVAFLDVGRALSEAIH